MGAGWMTTDYDQSGIPMDKPSVRVARLAESLDIMRAMWHDGQRHLRRRALPGDRRRRDSGAGDAGRPAAGHRRREPAHPHLGRAVRRHRQRRAEPGRRPHRPRGGGRGGRREVRRPGALGPRGGGERAGDLELQCWTVAVQVVPNADEVVASLAPLFDLTPEQLAAAPLALIGTVEEITEPAARAPRGARLQLHRRARGRDGRAGAGDRRTCRHLSTRPERIGILGGTFDPPHVGHVAAARAVMEQLGLDRLLLVVANDPWQKSGQRAVSPAEDRYALTEALAEEIPGAEASRLEIDRGGPSYSVDTAEEILARAGERPRRALPGRRGRPGPRARHLAPRPRTSSAWSPWPWCPGRPDQRPPFPRVGGPSGSTAPRSRSPARRSVTSWRRAGRSTAWSPDRSSVASAAAVCTLCLE